MPSPVSPGIPNLGGAYGYAATLDVPLYDPTSHAGGATVTGTNWTNILAADVPIGSSFTNLFTTPAFPPGTYLLNGQVSISGVTTPGNINLYFSGINALSRWYPDAHAYPINLHAVYTLAASAGFIMGAITDATTVGAIARRLDSGGMAYGATTLSVVRIA